MTHRYALDANVVLRFLRNDDPQQSPAAARLFAQAKAREVTLVLAAVTVAEIFYVLSRTYRLPRPAVAAILIPMLESEAIEAEDGRRVIDALRRVARANVDFGDAYLAAFAAEWGIGVASFDGDLLVFPDVETVVPS